VRSENRAIETFDVYCQYILIEKKKHISISSMIGSNVFITFKSDRNILSIDYGKDINKDITGRNKVSLLKYNSYISITNRDISI